MAFLRRLWNASPGSIAAATGRAIRGSSPRAAPPRWERASAGPLAGRELLVARDANGVWLDMLEGRFDVELYDALRAAVPEPGAIWDVGAHVGYHALGFAAAHRSARVLAIEPNEANLERLRANLARNADLASRVSVLPAAVSDREGTGTLVGSADLDGGASSLTYLAGSDPPLDRDAYTGFTRQTVVVRTIDGLAADPQHPPPDVIKVDVEGGELLVLRGAQHVLRSRQPMLLVEVHTIGLMATTHAFLAECGYRVHLLAEHTSSRCLIQAVYRSG